MATVTNISVNTATPTNKAYSSSSTTWAETEPRTWAEGGTFGNPQGIANKALNTATITNKALS